MWLPLIEKKEALLAIYKDEVPDLDGLLLHEIKIVTGQDTIISIRFDLGKLPREIPKKWMDRNINAIQITLELVQAKILGINLEKAIASVDNIIIDQIDNYKRLVLRDDSNAEVLTIRSSWIYLGLLNGYQRR